MPKLLVQESAGIREFDLVDAEVHIGRELDNSLRLADPSISRHHCLLRRTPNGFEISDLQSSNGVLVNGSRVQTAPLRDGDRLTLGQIQLTFSDPAPAPVPGIGTKPVTRDMLPDQPSGTVRMSADQMAAIHGAPAPAPAETSTRPLSTPPPTPTPAEATARRPTQHMPVQPTFGQFTNPGIKVEEESQGFLAKLLGFFKRG